MAKGDYVVFNQFKKDMGEKIHDLSSDTFHVSLIKSAANGGIDPTAATSDPRWGAGGSTNLLSSEVTPGGNYSTGGDPLAVTWVEAAGTVTWDSDNTSFTQNGSNPTNARWGIHFNNTASGKQAVGYIDLGSDFDMTTGALEIQTPSDIFTLA